MKELVKIRLFKKVTISYKKNEIDLTNILGKKLVNLFELFAINKDSEVTYEEIHNKLWPENNDYKKTIKYAVYRLRKELNEIKEIKHLDLIDTTEEGYRLSDKYSYDVDVLKYNDLYLENIAENEKLSIANCKAGIYIVDIYKGRLYLSKDAPIFLELYANKMTSFYVDTIRKMSEFLLAREKYMDVIKLNTAAANIEPYTETIHYYYLKALLAQKNYHAAQVYYDNIHEKFVSKGNLEFSSEFKALYKEIVENSNVNEKDKKNLEYVEGELMSSNRSDGAFYCNYGIFKNLYEMTLKYAKRYGGECFLTLFSLDKVQDDVDLVKTSASLKEIIENSIRESDIFAKINERQFVVLQICDSKENSYKIIDRISKAFYRKHNSYRCRLSYAVKQVEK